jgi:hypothetical protein
MPAVFKQVVQIMTTVIKRLIRRGYHYHAHDSLPLLPTRRLTNRIHTLSFYFFKLHFNITLPFIPRYLQQVHFFKCHHKDLVHIPLSRRISGGQEALIWVEIQNADIATRSNV